MSNLSVTNKADSGLLAFWFLAGCKRQEPKKSPVQERLEKFLAENKIVDEKKLNGGRVLAESEVTKCAPDKYLYKFLGGWGNPRTITTPSGFYIIIPDELIWNYRDIDGKIRSADKVKLECFLVHENAHLELAHYEKERISEMVPLIEKLLDLEEKVFPRVGVTKYSDLWQCCFEYSRFYERELANIGENLREIYPPMCEIDCLLKKNVLANDKDKEINKIIENLNDRILQTFEELYHLEKYFFYTCDNKEEKKVIERAEKYFKLKYDKGKEADTKFKEWLKYREKYREVARKLLGEILAMQKLAFSKGSPQAQQHIFYLLNEDYSPWCRFFKNILK